MAALPEKRDIKSFLKVAFLPGKTTFLLLFVWLLYWAWVLVGAAIFQAQENPYRREEEATALGQGELTYFEAIYFTHVFMSTVGYGDIVPVSNGGRAIVFVWSFIGSAVWGVFVYGFITKLTNWVYYGIVWNLIHLFGKNKTTNSNDSRMARLEEWGNIGGQQLFFAPPQKRSDEKRVPSPEQAEATTTEDKHERVQLAEEKYGEEKEPPREMKKEATMRSLKKVAKRERAVAKPPPVERAEHTWLTIFALILAALVIWAVIHVVGAAVFYKLEPNLGNLGDYTPNTFGNVFYFAFITSQTAGACCLAHR
ncbi:hypothetical protein QOT17_006977 [Balamuthia mandrillaris]